jgi:hypothetical protein
LRASPRDTDAEPRGIGGTTLRSIGDIQRTQRVLDSCTRWSTNAGTSRPLAARELIDEAERRT